MVDDDRRGQEGKADVAKKTLADYCSFLSSFTRIIAMAFQVQSDDYIGRLLWRFAAPSRDSGKCKGGNRHAQTVMTL